MYSENQDDEKLALQTAKKLEENTRVYLIHLIRQLAPYVSRNQHRELKTALLGVVKKLEDYDSSGSSPHEKEACKQTLTTLEATLQKINDNSSISTKKAADLALHDKLNKTIELQKIFIGEEVAIEDKQKASSYSEPKEQIRVCEIRIKEYKSEVDLANTKRRDGFARRRNQRTDDLQNFLGTMLLCIPNALRYAFTRSFFKRTEGAQMIDRSSDLIKEYRSNDPKNIAENGVKNLQDLNDKFFETLKKKMLKNAKLEIYMPEDITMLYIERKIEAFQTPLSADDRREIRKIIDAFEIRQDVRPNSWSILRDACDKAIEIRGTLDAKDVTPAQKLKNVDPILRTCQKEADQGKGLARDNDSRRFLTATIGIVDSVFKHPSLSKKSTEDGTEADKSSVRTDRKNSL